MADCACDVRQLAQGHRISCPYSSRPRYVHLPKPTELDPELEYRIDTELSGEQLDADLVGGYGEPDDDAAVMVLSAEEEQAAEDKLTEWVIRQGTADYLLRTHVKGRYGDYCAADHCERHWPCVWWQRGTEVKRRQEQTS